RPATIALDGVPEHAVECEGHVAPDHGDQPRADDLHIPCDTASEIVRDRHRPGGEYAPVDAGIAAERVVDDVGALASSHRRGEARAGYNRERCGVAAQVEPHHVDAGAEGVDRAALAGALVAAPFRQVYDRRGVQPPQLR